MKLLKVFHSLFFVLAPSRYPGSYYQSYQTKRTSKIEVLFNKIYQINCFEVNLYMCQYVTTQNVITQNVITQNATTQSSSFILFFFTLLFHDFYFTT